MYHIFSRIFLIILILCSFGNFFNNITGISIFWWSNIVFAVLNEQQKNMNTELTLSSAQEENYQNDLEGKTANSFLSVITSYVLMASMFIAVTMFIYGSYELFTSEWDPKKHSEAIKGMIYSWIAFLIISFSYTLVEVASRFQVG